MGLSHSNSFCKTMGCSHSNFCENPTKDQCQSYIPSPSDIPSCTAPDPPSPQKCSKEQCQQFMPPPPSPKQCPSNNVPEKIQQLILSTMSEAPTCTGNVQSFDDVNDAFSCSLKCGFNELCEASQYKANKNLCWLKSGCTGGTVGELPPLDQSNSEFAQWYKKRPGFMGLGKTEQTEAGPGFMDLSKPKPTKVAIPGLISAMEALANPTPTTTA